MTSLEPIDLLRLARTSHFFRGMLMRKGAKTIWEAARSNLAKDFPACPDWLSEPAYANLIFSKECHVRVPKDWDKSLRDLKLPILWQICQKKVAGHLICVWGTRLCKDCLDSDQATYVASAVLYEAVALTVLCP